MTKLSLPIDEFIPHIQEHLLFNNNLILKATPGAGKTTRIPPCLLKVTEKTILVLEPRRLAARLSALRVSQEMEEECGNTVGYQVRFEKKESSKTRIKFITEGLFLRLLLSQPNLQDVGCVVLDEFHERHVHSDIALMLVTYLQKTSRPDLKLVVMSATLETKNLNEYLPSAKVIICETKNYPVTVEYLNSNLLSKSLDLKVLFALEKILKNKEDKGHVLVFLPGRFDIQKCAQILQNLQLEFNFNLFQLSADTSFEEQQKIFQDTSKRKVILSTNVAETSITIDGVSNVIDSGLAKISGHAFWSGFSTLELKPISQSSCVQRSGRAGRTGPGHTIRLFSQYDFNLRPQFDLPEILRVDLTQYLLELNNLNFFQNSSYSTQSENSYPWFESPPQNTLESCLKLLNYLGSIDAAGGLTEIGKTMSHFPFHPRLSRILMEGKTKGLFPQALLIVTLINEGMIFKKNIELHEFSNSDIYYQMNILKKYFLEKNLSPSLQNCIDKNQIKKIENLLRQLCSNYKISFTDCFQTISEQELSFILFSGFPDRVCKIRHVEDKSQKNKLFEYNLCLGGGAVLSKTSSVVDEEFILALVAEESLSKTQSHSTQIQFCHGLHKSFFSQIHKSNFIIEKQECIWNSEKKIAACVKRIYYGKVVLKEEQVNHNFQDLEDILLNELKKSWPLPFENDLPLQYFNEKVQILKSHNIDFPCDPFFNEELELFLISLCEGKKSFSQILEKTLIDSIEDFIGQELTHRLNNLLPSSILVGKGRKIPVHYESGKPPFVSSRLQDFFGTVQTPRILNNKISLVVHLLAPNGQSVQVTTDLAGFWERGYQEVRKELSRKYPRHSWPEDPKTAEPPDLVKKRR